jgi:hypothetical protein
MMSSAAHRIRRLSTSRVTSLSGHDVEVARRHPFEQHVNDLVGRPGARRFLGAPARGHAGKGRTRNQQARRNLAPTPPT